jgi:hydroxypyruvate isomerase
MVTALFANTSLTEKLLFSCASHASQDSSGLEFLHHPWSEGWSREVAHDQLVRAFTWTAEAIARFGTVIGIEPINIKEANIIRFLDEAVSYARGVDRSEIKVVVNFYPLEEATPLTDMLRFGEWTCRVQTADSGGNRSGSWNYD